MITERNYDMHLEQDIEKWTVSSGYMVNEVVQMSLMKVRRAVAQELRQFEEEEYMEVVNEKEKKFLQKEHEVVVNAEGRQSQEVPSVEGEEKLARARHPRAAQADVKVAWMGVE